MRRLRWTFALALKLAWSAVFVAAAISEVGHDASLVGVYLVAASAPLWVHTS